MPHVSDSSTTPSVSVVVPSFNYEHFLPDAVMSALGQRDVAVDVIIVDDCSTDESRTVARDLASTDDRITVLEHERNLGLVATINDGIAASRGDLLAVLSADDALAPGALVRAADVFASHVDVGLVFGRRKEFHGSDELHAAWRSPEPLHSDSVHVHEGRRWLDRRCRQGVNLLASPEVIVRATAQRAVGPYSERCRHTSDLNMWLRIASRFDVAFLDGAPLAWYRRHDANMSAVAFGEQGIDALERWRAFDDALSRHDGPSWERRSATAKRSIARALLHESRRVAEDGVPTGLDRDGVDRLVSIATTIDQTTTRDMLRSDGSVRRDMLGRLVHRWRWRRWLAAWNERGW